MRRVLLLGIALVLAIAESGCATVTNMQEETRQKPYGGDQMGKTSATPFWPVSLLDQPLNLVLDAETLPYTIWRQLSGENNNYNFAPGLTARQRLQPAGNSLDAGSSGD